MGLYIIYPINKEMGLQSLFCEIYGHFLKTSLLFLYKLKFSEAYVSLNIDLGSIKVLAFLDFADQTEQLWQIYYPNQDGSLYYLSNKQKQMGLQSLLLWNLWPFTDKFTIISIQIEIFRVLYLT